MINEALDFNSESNNTESKIHGTPGNEGYYLDENGVVIIEDIAYSRNRVKKSFSAVRKEVKNYLKQLNGVRVIIKADNRLVIFDSNTAKEYMGSVDTELSTRDEKRNKANLTRGIIGIVERASNPRWRPNTKAKHVTDAKRGFTYYEVRFGFLADGTTYYYKGLLIIRMDADGKDYVYDVTSIQHMSTKRETNHSATSQANQSRSVSL